MTDEERATADKAAAEKAAADKAIADKAVEEEANKNRTYSQAELDAAIRDRIGRAEAKFADYDDLKIAAAKLAEIEEANKTEAQRLADEIERLKTAAAEANSRAEKTLIDSAIIAAATAANLVDTNVAKALIDPTSITIKDGVVVGANEAIAALAVTYPYLVKSDGAPSIVTGSGDASTDLGSMTQEQYEKARGFTS